jgi:non-homologous end joining protein Ku
MAPKAEAKGFSTLSLVSWGIAPVQVTSPRQRFRFNIIKRGSGNQVRPRHIDARNGEEVPGGARAGVGRMMADGSGKAFDRAI